MSAETRQSIMAIARLLLPVVLLIVSAAFLPWSIWVTNVTMTSAKAIPKLEETAEENHDYIAGHPEHERALIAELKTDIGKEIRDAIKPVGETLDDIRDEQHQQAIAIERIKIKVEGE